MNRDGPAAIAATDNEWVIAANDRNGLRPLRYAIIKIRCFCWFRNWHDRIK